MRWQQAALFACNKCLCSCTRALCSYSSVSSMVRHCSLGPPETCQHGSSLQLGFMLIQAHVKGNDRRQTFALSCSLPLSAVPKSCVALRDVFSQLSFYAFQLGVLTLRLPAGLLCPCTLPALHLPSKICVSFICPCLLANACKLAGRHYCVPIGGNACQCVQTGVNADVCSCAHVGVSICVLSRARVCVCVCVCVCVHVCVGI
jgi:hypothetical protein